MFKSKSWLKTYLYAVGNAVFFRIRMRVWYESDGYWCAMMTANRRARGQRLAITSE